MSVKKKTRKSAKGPARKAGRKPYRKPELVKHGVLSIVEGD